jgi:hypothetical protein
MTIKVNNMIGIVGNPDLSLPTDVPGERLERLSVLKSAHVYAARSAILGEILKLL